MNPMFVSIIVFSLIMTGLCLAAYQLKISQLFDNLIVWTLSRVFRFQVDLHRWNSSYLSRRRLYFFYLVGLILIALLPFEILWWANGYQTFNFAQYCSVALVPKGGFPSPFNHKRMELWEVAVAMWTLVFFLAFLFLELPEHSASMDKKKWISQFSMLALLLTSIVIFINFRFLLYNEDPSWRVLAGLSTAALLCVFDVVIYFSYRKGTTNTAISNDFLLFFAVLDFPVVLAFFTLFIYLKLLENIVDLPSRQHFAAGASALNLVLANTLFSIMYIIERYKTPIVEETQVANASTPIVAVTNLNA